MFTSMLFLFSFAAGATSGYYSLNHESTVKGDYEIDFQQGQIDLKAGLNLDDKEKVLHNFRFLKGELDADILCDYFYQDNHFSTDDLEDVKSEKTRHEQVDFLLRKLLRLKPEAYLKFLEYLEDAGYNYVRKVLEESVFSLALNHEDVTETEARLRLKQFQKEICEQMQPDVIADMFLEYEEFTLDEYEEVIAEKTRRRKSEKILGLLKSFKHIERGLLVLLQALKETDGLYLYRLLKDGGAAYAAMQDSRHTVNVKVKVDKVKKRESKSKTAFLKEEKQCRVTLEVDGLESDQDLEVKITRAMQNPDVMVSINDNIIIGNECLIGNVEQGSIVIILKGCNATSLRRLFAKDVERPISDILHHIFIHPDIVKLLTTKKLKFRLTLSCQPTEQKELKTNLERIKSNLEFLVEELDALTFLKKLKEENVLSKEDEKEILETTPTSRKTRTRAMLQKLIDCDAIETFINILKEKKEYVWKHVFQSGEGIHTLF
ncbi:uncharacterized protein LOC123561116 [Mercenaria mercenaria]|uniref:uncharacterized protein LOC123561116 n=1 Tax=Mercenaria mercenaria TaxID=6596 RepID=UPI00234F3229|nr:uncharacterized protein LOC123561116 [Mercenaria mercenaria]